jgi:hypothetical protein
LRQPDADAGLKWRGVLVRDTGSLFISISTFPQGSLRELPQQLKGSIRSPGMQEIREADVPVRLHRSDRVFGLIPAFIPFL